jgi:hypothetical protein
LGIHCSWNSHEHAELDDGSVGRPAGARQISAPPAPVDRPRGVSVDVALTFIAMVAAMAGVYDLNSLLLH